MAIDKNEKQWKMKIKNIWWQIVFFLLLFSYITFYYWIYFPFLFFAKESGRENIFWLFSLQLIFPFILPICLYRILNKHWNGIFLFSQNSSMPMMMIRKSKLKIKKIKINTCETPENKTDKTKLKKSFVKEPEEFFFAVLFLF